MTSKFSGAWKCQGLRGGRWYLELMFAVWLYILCAKVSCMEMTVQGTSEVFLNQNEPASIVFLGKILLTDIASKTVQQFNTFKYKFINLAGRKFFLIFPIFFLPYFICQCSNFVFFSYPHTL